MTSCSVACSQPSTPYYISRVSMHILKTMNSATHDPKLGKKSRSNPLQVKHDSAKPGRLDKYFLAQVAWVTFPALILVRMGEFMVGSLWCFLFLLAFLARYALIGNMPAFVALTVASLPALTYMRIFFFYNSIGALLGLGLALWFLRSPKECVRLWENSIFRLFFMTGTVYWLLSVLLTRKYYANFGVMEMVCSVGSIYLLGRHPKYLGAALMGLSVSIISVAIGMIGKGDRLGMAEIDGMSIGNPIFFGLPTALVLLLTMADNGKWMFLQHSKIVKNFIIAICGVFLLLSTSRSSWLVVLVGVMVIIFFQSQHRRKVFVGMFFAGCLLTGVLQTESGEKVLSFFEMATDAERTWSEKTTGRAQQWQLFPKVLADSPIWGVGPGRGPETWANYSWVDEEVTLRQGKNLAWHSIYLQIGVETGLLGLTILTGFLMKLTLHGFVYCRMTKDIVPLLAILCFMAMGVFGHMLESLSGLFLGLAFLGTTFPPKTLRKESSNSV